MSKEEKKLGRPSVDTPEVRRKIEEAAAFDASVEEIAFFAGIHRDTLHQILKKDKVFSDRIAALRNNPVMKARASVINSFRREPELALKYLERKRRKEFATKQEVEHSGEVNIGQILDEAEKK